jgi:hypothetical protein
MVFPSNGTHEISYGNLPPKFHCNSSPLLNKPLKRPKFAFFFLSLGIHLSKKPPHQALFPPPFLPLHIMQEAKPNSSTSFPPARRVTDQEVLPPLMSQPTEISAGEIPPPFLRKLSSPGSSPELVPFPHPSKQMPDKPPKNRSANIVSGLPSPRRKNGTKRDKKS